MFGTVSGAVAGLVAITPSCGFVNFTGALITGGVIGIISYFAVSYLKPKLGYDDSLDAFGVHAVGGFWGIIVVGLMATVSVNAAGANGLFNGNSALLFSQLKCALFAVVYCALVTWIVCWVTNKIIPMRVSPEGEIIGLDLSQHHERAYTILD
jgi:Amt family ammonium transporter